MDPAGVIARGVEVAVFARNLPDADYIRTLTLQAGLIVGTERPAHDRADGADAQLMTGPTTGPTTGRAPLPRRWIPLYDASMPDAAPIPLQANLTLSRDTGSRVGADRIALLRAIGVGGSISAAAKAVGLSYKAAWDAVQAMNNLFDRPLVVPSAGGSSGGASVVTPVGERVIAAFDAVAVELAATIARLEDSLSGSPLKPLLTGTAMKTSARNALRGTIARIVEGTVEAEVVLAVAYGVEIVATITRASVAALGLAPGVSATALIKASFVILARGEPGLRTSARNTLAGVVTAREDGAIGSAVTLELQVGKTLVATLTRESADALDLSVGTPAFALIKASHVVLAID